ncbi:MAG: cytochrome c maturation protein CcmE [Gammaproteobacteria bacterium]|nr:cytochrome c maturation protein CcmE [Gammaproteobacteria bacterium]
MKPRHKRMVMIVLALVVLAVAATLVLRAFNSNLVFFFTPSDVVANKVPQQKTFRLGGLVEQGSLQRQDNGLTVHFRLTDNAQTVKVVYTGILPDLFREGRGAVTEGRMGPDGEFHAEQVLAKHDENYMPPEVAEALKKTEQDRQAAAAATGAQGK